MAIWEKKKPLIRYNEDDDIIDKLAKINGITNVQNWLVPSESFCHSPYLLDNIDEVAVKIIEAIKNGLRITVFGDIDADGVTSLVILTKYLRELTDDVDQVQIMHSQRSDGHGIETVISTVMVEDVSTLTHCLPPTDLLIIVDSSTNSVDACEFLSTQGIEIIILDHHLSNKINPYALIVNNQMCNYPNKELSGAGIVYKVCQVLDDKLQENYAFQFIDLAGLGIYGDVMSMAELENRWFVYNSLKNITNYGLQALLRASGVFDLKSMDYGFTVVPIINASTRLDKIELIIELLLCENLDDAKRLAKECVALNKLRKKMQKDISEELIPEIDSNEKITIVITDKSSKGFNGLIATNISEKFQKPCLILAHTKDGMIEGSARTFNNFNLNKFLLESNLFEYCEGHDGALGVGLKYDNLEVVKAYIQENLNVDSFSQVENVVYYDLEIDASDITDEFVKKVAWFNYISGKDFPQAKFLVNNYYVDERTVLGENNDTIKLKGDNLVAMKFKTKPDYAEEVEFSSIDMVGTVNINKWWHRGIKSWVVTNQVFIEDFKQ